MRKLRIAIVTETFLPKVDGIVTVICLLLDHLAQREVEAVIFAPRLGEIDHYGPARVITAPGMPFPFYPDLRLALPTLTTYSELRDFQPDVVHLVHPSAFGLASYLMVRRMGLPTLVSYHIDYGQLGRHFRWGPFHAGFIDLPIRFLTRQVLNTADYALAPSRAVQQRLLAMGVRKAVGLWRRGVDAERFHPRHASAAMRHRLAQGSMDDVLLLYVGRLSYEKQLDQLRPVLERVPGTRLALVGDGPARAMLQKHFAGLPACFMGYLQGEALPGAYASADMFVFPSAMESFGLVVVEAMAAGLPVVASRVGGVGEVVREGVNGYSFVPGDIDALVAGVRRIAHSRETMATMGAAARAFAETQTWPAMMDEVIMHYQRLAAAGKPVRGL